MNKNKIFKHILPVNNRLKGDKIMSKNNELEPPPDDRRTHLLWAGNLDRHIGNSLLYLRWAPFGYPVGNVKLVNDSPRIFYNRKNSYLNKLVSHSKLFGGFCLWMLYSYDAF